MHLAGEVDWLAYLQVACKFKNVYNISGRRIKIQREKSIIVTSLLHNCLPFAVVVLSFFCLKMSPPMFCSYLILISPLIVSGECILSLSDIFHREKCINVMHR